MTHRIAGYAEITTHPRGDLNNKVKLVKLTHRITEH